MPSKRENLIRAASKGNLKAFKNLLQPDQSISLQQADLTLEKLAAIAASEHHAKFLQFCISLGAHVNNDAVRSGALKSSSLNVYKVLVPAGIDLNYEHDGNLGGPLIWAAFRNDIRLATYLLEQGAEVNGDHQTRLQTHVYRPLAKAAQKNSVEMIELFIKHGAEVDRSGALIVAAEHGNLEAVQCLVSHGANIDLIRMSDTELYTRTNQEESALHKAIKAGHEHVVVFLMERGAQLDLRNHEGMAALEISVKVNNAEIFQIIYDARN